MVVIHIPGNLAFFRAIREAMAEEVAKMLDADPSLLELEDMWGCSKRRPLASAARHCNLALARMLVARGANINAADRFGLTALHFAARFGSREMVAFLLSKGAELQRRPTPQCQLTPIMEAAQRGHLDVVQLLFEHMEGKGLCDNDRVDGLTLLHCAAERGWEGVATYLLSKGAQADAQNMHRSTPLMMASTRNQMGVVKVLLRHMGRQGLDLRNDMGRTALHGAADMGHDTVVRHLLLAGADATIRDHEGATPRELSERQPEFDGGDTELLEEKRACVVQMFEWWEGELERRYILYRATRLHKASATQGDSPRSQVPIYLEGRVAAGQALPSVEVESRQARQAEQRTTRSIAHKAEASGKRKAAGERGDALGAEAEEEEEERHAAEVEQERHATVDYVLKGLHEDLVTELLDGFQRPKRQA